MSETVGSDLSGDRPRRTISVAWRSVPRTARVEGVQLDRQDCRDHDFGVEADLSNGSCVGTNFELQELERALFQGSTLTGAIFRRGNLEEANFEGAKLGRADLAYARLRAARFGGADVLKANFRDADLRDADFRGVSGLSAAQLAGADVGGALLPAAVAEFQEVDRVDETARSGRKLFVPLLLACAYSWLAIATTTDAKLLANSPSSPLPVIATTIPLLWFYVTAPLVLLGLYVYFHLHLQRLWTGLGTLPAFFPDGRALSRRAFPWVVCDYAWHHIPRLNLVSAAALAESRVGQESSRARRLSARIEHAVICALTWWVVPATMALFWIRALPRQTWPLTVLHIVALVIAIWLAVRFQRLAAAAVGGRPHGPLFLGPVRNDLPFYGRLLGFVAVLTVIGFTSLGALLGSRVHGVSGSVRDCAAVAVDAVAVPSAIRRAVASVWAKLGYDVFANVEDAVFSVKEEESRRSIWAGPTQFSGRRLRYARASGAGFEGLRFDDADLTGIALNHAKVQRASFARVRGRESSWLCAEAEEATFEHAQLDGALFLSAKLAGARLAHASLKGANFGGADLRRGVLRSADLRNARFRWTPPVASSPPRATLLQRGQSLETTPMLRVDLAGADLTNAIVAQADFRGVDLGDVRGLTATQLASALTDSTTVLPRRAD